MISVNKAEDMPRIAETPAPYGEIPIHWQSIMVTHRLPPVTTGLTRTLPYGNARDGSRRLNRREVAER